MSGTSTTRPLTKQKKPSEELGDFTTTPRVLPISLMAIVIGLISSGVAWLLLKLIGLFTNLFYYQRINTALWQWGHRVVMTLGVGSTSHPGCVQFTILDSQ